MVRSDIGSDTSRTTGAAVRFEGLTKYYDDVAAVDGISLRVKAGEFLTLLGPSGSGKTSTLMMMTLQHSSWKYVSSDPVVASKSSQKKKWHGDKSLRPMRLIA